MAPLLQRLLSLFGAHSWIDGDDITVRRYAPNLPNWPQHLELRIAMLSDFHFSEPWIGLQALEAIVEKTNALKPDIILLVGDFEDGPRFSQPVAPDDWARGLARLQAPLGVHAVLGNHDYPRIIAKRHRFLAEPAAKIALEKVGIPVHINDAIPMAWSGKNFWLAGLGDQCTEYENGSPLADLDATLTKVTDDAPVILMAHEPDIFPEVPARVALTLSGHVHRGQIRFFGFAPVVPSRYGRRYLHGHIVENNRHLIVGAGLGHSGLPLRFDAAPEIVLIELGGQA
ncbi:metallophosphoesterase [Devosia sp.]|uniref:metallophosphoesterase n=1 Tax=Devosia sp. TaxID=1871048 RepID=UPI001B2AFF0D|nr:metallophosphoesterase [Devosia sp.]MBO9589865.1 metallophosphoesterase [Devosia sp.]